MLLKLKLGLMLWIGLSLSHSLLHYLITFHSSLGWMFLAPSIIYDLYSLLSYLSLGLSSHDKGEGEDPALVLTPNPFWDGSGLGWAGQGSRKKIMPCKFLWVFFFFFLFFWWQCKGEGNVAFEPPFKPTFEVCFSSANSTNFDSFLRGKFANFFINLKKKKPWLQFLTRVYTKQKKEKKLS